MTAVNTRVVIVSSNTFVRLGLRRTFEGHPGVLVVGECLWSASARELLEQERPDLIIVDLEFDMNHDEVVHGLRASAPEARIVLLTGWTDMERGRQAMEAGADVIMMKCQPAPILLAIIDTMTKQHATPPTRSLVLARQTPPPSGGKPFAVPAQRTDSLTDRERAVVALVGQGLSNRDIAERLCISDTTVRHHLTSIFDKLGVPNRQKLLLLAHQQGLTELRASA